MPSRIFVAKYKTNDTITKKISNKLIIVRLVATHIQRVYFILGGAP